MISPIRNSKINLSSAPKIDVRNVYAIANINKHSAPPQSQGALVFKSRQNYSWGLPVVVFAAIAGIAVGSYGTWVSKYGRADSLDYQGSVLSAATNEPWVMPMEYDPSELNVVADFLPELIEENHREPTAEELEHESQKEKLKAYFAKWKSPFAKDDAALESFLKSKNMRLMIAISFVESSMGKKCYYNNCSGIGGTPPKLRKYDNFSGWIADFDSLLERRYKGLPVEKFMGLYVQPGSPNWINGVKQILGELKELEID
jgi:hypothetical protein